MAGTRKPTGLDREGHERDGHDHVPGDADFRTSTARHLRRSRAIRDPESVNSSKANRVRTCPNVRRR
jgi:hypothetical protein